MLLQGMQLVSSCLTFPAVAVASTFDMCLGLCLCLSLYLWLSVSNSFTFASAFASVIVINTFVPPIIGDVCATTLLLFVGDGGVHADMLVDATIIHL